MTDIRNSSSLTILLIKPSKYDDDGYVVHHARGVLPSNTLYVLNALFRDCARDASCHVGIHLIDETVQLVRPDYLMYTFARKSATVLVGLVGVQTNQFVRAADLARQFRAHGALVQMGGFHVSGTVSTLGVTAELQELLDKGVSLFVGEAEGRLSEVLQDARAGALKPIYQPHAFPDLSRPWPLPCVDPSISKRFALSHAGTIDTSRGCVFRCSFCTVIQVQGKIMRSRRVSDIEQHIRAHFPATYYYFFTDDNMARNREWSELFSRLIALKREGIRIKFMMQVDTAAHRLPGFCAQAAQAGCSQVFIGVESLNPQNLQGTGKVQNKVERFEEMVCAWHRAGVAVHAAYIVGFPHDSQASVANDVDSLAHQVQPDQASIFMLTPLPGSIDHRELLKNGAKIDSDYNKYDSFHDTMIHPRMAPAEWRSTYAKAWDRMYSLERLVTVLRKLPAHLYWDIFKNTAWYRYAINCEEQHPMITGFWRLKGRMQRRMSLPLESRFKYAARRVRDTILLVRRLCALTLSLESLWRDTWLRRRGRAILPSLREVRWKKSVGQFSRLSLLVRSFTRTMMRLYHRYHFLKTHRARHCANRFGLPKFAAWHLQRALLAPLQPLTRVWLFLLNFAVEA